jgi:hypothetical protein
MNSAIRFLIVFLISAPAFGFSLMGPLAPWMTPQNGFSVETDVGGPMRVGAGYRWNIPVVTYGFDESFMNFFGERGAAAIEDAVRQLNTISSAGLSLLPTNTIRLHLNAQSLGLIDLKSAALSATLEQMGLAEALRNAFVIRYLAITSDTTNYLIVQRNYDPTTLTPSDVLNGSRLAYDLHAFSDGSFDAIEYPIDQSHPANVGIAGSQFRFGEYVTALTADDVGGLRYLYATNSYKLETLPPGIQAVDGDLVNAALRPGRGRITFEPQQWNFATHSFDAVTSRFVDIYLDSHGFAQTQYVQRQIAMPDIIFSAADLGARPGGEPILISKTSAANWINNSTLGGGQSDEGPGVIMPGAVITFSKAVNMWGTFDQSGAYYQFDLLSDRSLPKFELTSADAANVTFKLTGVRRKYTISATSDFITWSNLSTVSNTTITIFQMPAPTTGQTFYRAVEGPAY